ncbi:RNase_H superfamily protein [Natronoarchaeum philippinense]|uniref:RNase_H superfamily protein n=1 Tax=Natronoarchaeum philippinense TaxID=558529 RepID=A0A285PCY3_NATPI|nr:ribonuclease H-like domain-containing protein [Natronoarchaeum philippinense]SNZ17721.1 RNase_H superfamily protein [Natronoarchaeum philippinense]
MQITLDDAGHERVATLDIETTHYDAAAGELVSIGVGVHDRGASASTTEYRTFHRGRFDEAEVVERAMAQLDDFGADALVSYNGTQFDLQFIEDRLDILGRDDVRTLPEYAQTNHIDLFVPRKRIADYQNVEWPALEDCLDAYEYPRPETVWNGDPVTNTRFGEELGPLFLDSRDDAARTDALSAVIDHYLITDLEANIALYYADIGHPFEPARLGDVGEFEVAE